MFQSSSCKGLQQTSSSLLPQINEDKSNSTPTSTKAVGAGLGWKKLVDAFNMSDASLANSESDDMNISFSSGMSALTNTIMSATATLSSTAKKQKQSKKNNFEEQWSQNQAMNLQTGSSTRWIDNDDKSRPRDCWN
jgi:hypothetical protein